MYSARNEREISEICAATSNQLQGHLSLSPSLSPFPLPLPLPTLPPSRSPLPFMSMISRIYNVSLQIYRIYSNNQEYEMFRVNDNLSTIPNETRMVVRLGRALQAGEVRVRLSLLRLGETEVTYFHSPIPILFRHNLCSSIPASPCSCSVSVPLPILPFCHSPVLQTTDGLYHH